MYKCNWWLVPMACGLPSIKIRPIDRLLYPVAVATCKLAPANWISKSL